MKRNKTLRSNSTLKKTDGFKKYRERIQEAKTWKPLMGLGSEGKNSLRKNDSTNKRDNPISIRKRINQVSKRRKKENEEYLRLRAIYLTANPVCQRCKRVPSSQLHHKFGREGKLLCHVPGFMASCPECHRWIEENRAEAEKQGWIVRRITGKDIDTP